MAFLFGYAGAPDGYAPEEAIFWWVAIGMGAVVVIVVVLLLGSLLSMVKSIDRSVAGVKETLRILPQSTENTSLIPHTADGVDAILAEGIKHHQYLTKVLSGG